MPFRLLTVGLRKLIICCYRSPVWSIENCDGEQQPENTLTADWYMIFNDGLMWFDNDDLTCARKVQLVLFILRVSTW